MPIPAQTVIDRMLIGDLIQRERAARDGGLWEEMAACWHHDSLVDVSWFRGTGPDFAAASQKNAAGQTLSFHQMSPSVVKVYNDRSIAETGCAITSMRVLGKAEVVIVSHTRLFSRAVRADDDWLLAGLRCLYIRDVLLPRDPTQIPALDAAALESYRPSYRYLSYILAQGGHVPRLDLPGVDRPETVVALRAFEKDWLQST